MRDRCPALSSQKHGLNAGNVCFLQDFAVYHVDLPLNAHNGTKAPLVEAFLKLHLFTLQSPGFTPIRESGDNCSSVNQDLLLTSAVSGSSKDASASDQIKTCWFWRDRCRYLGNCGIVRDNFAKVGEVLNCVKHRSIHGDVCKAIRSRWWMLFLSRLIVRPKAFPTPQQSTSFIMGKKYAFICKK